MASSAPSKTTRSAAELVAETLGVSSAFQSSNPEHRFEVMTLDWKTLEIDPSIQRDEEADEIARIAREFNPAALGVITVSVRDVPDPDTGQPVTHWFIVDGQQRRAACRKVEYAGKLTATVHYGLTKPEEAQLFLDLNARKGVGPWSKFKSRLEAGDEQALAIQAILVQLEVPVGVPGGFTAIAKADSIFRANERGAANLRFALKVLKDNYGVYNAQALGGLAKVYDECHAFLDTGILAAHLAKYAPDMLSLIRAAKTLRQAHGGTSDTAWAEAIANFYNRGMRPGSRRSKALPSFYLGRRHKPTGADLDELAVLRADANDRANEETDEADES